MATKIGSFTELNTWKKAHKLVLSIYRVVKKFPGKERFVLTNQLLRAVISATGNIAKDFIKTWDQSIIVHKPMGGLIRSVKRI